jgi:hypothetical protein
VLKIPNLLPSDWYVVRDRNSINLVRMKHEKPNCTEQIVLRMPPALRDQIETAAAEEGRTLANMTRRILQGWASTRQPRHEQAA